MKKTIYFWVIFAFAACNVKQSVKENVVLFVQYDTIQIPITSEFLPYYTNIAGYHDSVDILYAYNPHLHHIDVFDITHGRCIKNIRLDKEGSNGILNVGKFNVCDNSIYTYTTPFYFDINFSGEINSKLDENKIEDFPYNDFSLKRAGVIITNFNELFINCTYKTVPVPVYSNSSFAGIGYIALDSGTFEMFSIPLPSFKGNYGNLETPFINWMGDTIIYNFPFSSSIYVYYINEKTHKEIKVNSIYTKNNANELANSKISWAAEAEHQVVSLQFLSVKYDPFRDLYYRIHLAPIDNMKFMNNRELYLTVMDNKFNYLKEFKLPQGIFSPIYIITREGIVFQMRSEEDTMYLLRVNIN